MTHRNNPRYARPVKRKRLPVLAAALLLTAAVTGAALIAKKAVPGDAPADSVCENPQESTLPDGTDAAALSAAVRFPYALEDGGPEVTSLFQYTGVNPDCGWTEGTGIGAVVLTNRSDRYLETLHLTLILADGTELSFQASDIPAGKAVWAFETGSGNYDGTAAVTEVRYDAGYRESGGLPPVSALAEGMNITLTNSSSEDLTGLTVRCHSVLDGAYFGGISCSYPVERIPAGASAAVFAGDCLLGQAEAVLVTYEKE